MELLKLCLLFRFELRDLLNDGLEYLVGRHVIELTQSSVYTLGILKGNVGLAVRAEYTLRLASEYDLFDALNVRVKRILAALSGTLLFLLLVSE